MSKGRAARRAACSRGTSFAAEPRMRLRTSACLLAVVLGSFATVATAYAGVPACPASLGGYTATIEGSDVIVCPTTTPPPGYSQSTGCPFTVGMVRVDTATGSTKGFLGPCVANPDDADGRDAGTPCYRDSCVPPGTYEYGYGIPAFAGCANEACAGPTSGEWAVLVTVAPTMSSCVPSTSLGPPAIWRMLDAGVDGGAVWWSATCTGPLPGPDGGYCAWEWLDGSAQWAPCPPDGGTLCPGYTDDGAAVPVPCPEAGGFNGGSWGNGSSPAPGESAADAAPGEGADAAPGNASHGCSCWTAAGGTAASIAPLVATVLALAVRVARRRRR